MIFQGWAALSPTATGLCATARPKTNRVSYQALRSLLDHMIGLHRNFSCLTFVAFNNAGGLKHIPRPVGTNVFLPSNKSKFLRHVSTTFGTVDGISFSTTSRYQLNNVQKKKDIRLGPGLEYFIANNPNTVQNDKVFSKRDLEKMSHPYIEMSDIQGHGRKVYFDVYGCQMNVNDTEVAWSILQAHGYLRTNKVHEADVVLVMTCSIREGAEQKIWNKLDYLRGLKNKRMAHKKLTPMKIGILGCMAERLKKKLVEKEKSIDIVVGPDSYRDLPRLLAIVKSGEECWLLSQLLSLYT